MFLRNSFQQETLSHMILDRTVFKSVFCGKKGSRSVCLTLCHPMDCSLPGSSIHGIFQARILEWVAISFSRESSESGIKPGAPHCGQTLYHLSHQGIPWI